MHNALRQQDHRPWPIPEGPWRWRQSWCDLLFAHWKVDAGSLLPGIPEGLELDTRDGFAWIGVVPFRMAGVTRRPLPDLPGVSAFPEVNVRTYVTRNGRPGVWFFSLDATNPLAIWAARRFFHLPYFRADIRIAPLEKGFDYACSRRQDDASFEVTFAPAGPVRRAEVGSLEHWLTERYCLYAESRRGQLFKTEVHHEAWPLQDAIAEFRVSRPGLGLELIGPPDLLHFSKRLDVVAWSPEVVG